MSEPFTLTDSFVYRGAVPGSARIACTSTKCLAVWWQESHIVARPLTNHGEPIGTTVLDLGFYNSLGYFELGTMGSRFVVAWPDTGMPIATISEEGRLERPQPLLGLANSELPLRIVGAAGTADTGGVLYISRDSNIDTLKLQRFRDGAIVGDPAGISFGTAVFRKSALGAAAGQFVVAQQNTVQRVQAATGVLLDSAPVVFTKYNHSELATAPAIAFDGENHLIAWVDGGFLYTTRMRASDGALLDPDDEFNQLTGARKICPIGDIVSELRLHVTGDQLIYTWRRDIGQTGYMEAISVPRAPWTSPSVSGMNVYLGEGGAREAFVTGDEGYHADDIAFVDDFGLRVLREPRLLRYGITLATHDFSVSPPVNTAPDYINFHGPARRIAGIAASGADFVAAHLDTDRQRVFVTRVDDETGQMLGSQVEVGYCNGFGWSADGALVGSNESGFLAVWTAGSYRCAQRIGCDGELGPLQIADRTGNLWSLHSDGNRYLLVQVSGGRFNTLRLDGDGVQLDSPVALDAAIGNVAVAADRAADPERRTFLVVAQRPDRVLGLRIRSGTGSHLSEVTLVNHATGSVFAASDGAQFLAGWSTEAASSYETSAMLVDAISGEPTSAPAILPFTRAEGLVASFDGASFLAFGYKENSQRAMRLSSSLEQIDAPDGLEVPFGVIASNRQGRTLSVRSNYDATRLGIAITGQLITNDLPVASGPATCDPPLSTGGTGSGGAGGVATGGSHAGSPSGGAATGGTPGTSGGTATGGTGSPTGGALATGGTLTGSGGTPGTGGTQTSSGGNATGGNATGGAGDAGQSSGGSAGSTGEAGAGTHGGMPDAGGASGASSAGAGGDGGDKGGAGATAGSSGAQNGGNAGDSGVAGGSDGDSPASNDTGCSCSVPKTRGLGARVLLVPAFALLLILRRRK
ncbi:MAG TPA: hypothetical protein VG937_32190 [Polyangiaceae bacterium]|nr:hypothetical protein [Polyangiaceae bacterium]